MQLTHDVCDALSAEAALGTLRGPAAKKWQRMCHENPALAANVSQWQQLLAPMAHWLPETSVPDGVWQGIEHQLFGTTATPAHARTLPAPTHAQRLPSRKRWAGLALALAASVGLWIALPSLSPVSPSATQAAATVAVLSSEHHATRWQISQVSDTQLRIAIEGTWAAVPSRSLQLWAIDASGTPHSLGLIEISADQATLRLSREQRVHVSNGTVFAISDEPLGGSPGALPTGPVLFTGVKTKTQG